MNAFLIINMAKNRLSNLFQFELRGTGRTISVINEAKDGSLIVVLEQCEVAYIKRTAREQCKDIIIVVAENANLHELFNKIRGRKYTSVHFDHRVIEKMIENGLRGISSHIEDFSREMSSTEPANSEPLNAYSLPTWLGSIKDEGI